MSLIRLSDAIENLREELKLSQQKGQGKDFQFSVGSIEVELEVVAEEQVGGSGKINWWVFGGGADFKTKDSIKHKLKLTLQVVDKDGLPIKVAQVQDKRPG
jgi:hypothetical protein